MRVYLISTCEDMIAHYDREAVNEGKPERWRALARCSASEWRIKLAAALSA
jgi:hypothetical protein